MADIMDIHLIDGNDQPATVFQGHGNQLAMLFDFVARAVERLEDVIGNGRRKASQPLLIDVVAFDGRHAEGTPCLPPPVGDETVTIRHEPKGERPCGSMPARTAAAAGRTARADKRGSVGIVAGGRVASAN